MFYVYVLQSIQSGWLYIGVTDTIDRRIKEHNNGKVRSTKSYRPYQLIKTEKYLNKTEALKRERQIKKSGLLRKVIKNTAPSSNG